MLKHKVYCAEDNYNAYSYFITLMLNKKAPCLRLGASIISLFTLVPTAF